MLCFDKILMWVERYGAVDGKIGRAKTVAAV